MASNRTPFDQLVDKFEPAVREAFMESYDRIKANVTPAMLRRIVAELDRGNIEAAIELLNIDRAAFAPIELAVADTFNRGGIIMAGELGRAQISFGVRNLVAEAILARYSAELVTRELEQTKALIRFQLSEGLSRGDNPTRSALDMVGRVDRVSGRRTGGYIGLSGPQERTQAKARQALISGDVEGMRDYLNLRQRDRRFDRAIIKAIEAGQPISRADADRIIGRLNDRQLRYRADVISTNETFNALSMAKNEGIRQAIESGRVDVRAVTLTWKHTPGQEHPRLQHAAMDGQTVPFGQPFVAPDGTLIAFPHAPGLPARHTVGCKCQFSVKIDYAAALIRRRALSV
jgi:hypothetical protein